MEGGVFSCRFYEFAPLGDTLLQFLMTDRSPILNVLKSAIHLFFKIELLQNIGGRRCIRELLDEFQGFRFY